MVLIPLKPQAKTQPQDEGLHLPSPKAYLLETEVLAMLGWTRRALLNKPEGKRPPCIKLSPRKRIYDPDELSAWIASLPRSR
ncbi:MAG: hypothetical protein IPP78_14605 [Holophagaceae bacterium]|nr:hypothetical protein [Holophagaceae bacterium]